ncbi:coproporphyrinogen III oxidase [Bacillus coahuilensis p1.1.43]|uniref:Heme chaperone HemW n=1 Tax=Bacillus coahuilensis p1.1.43 TaxID=1150625 RepID=A0A147K7L0_9BACI|nr:radical SAM family heme chaperone HemW [Bacillus coahuilensis]KUP06070.1 coproporphyrinogen III oxidase [Bacillus coahuilensis p1.1.43]
MISSTYIHIPFCHHICHYCDFNKFYLKNQPVDEYLATLDQEMSLTFDLHPPGEMKTVFVGGGTPTALTPKQLEKLCQSILARAGGQIEEFTFEANPGELTEDKLRVLKEYGVNRLSLGVQSFNDDLLKAIGRTHQYEDIVSSIDAAIRTGITNVSLDLIYSLPNQTVEDFKETLDIALAFDLPHYSGYSLIVEPKTVFYNRLRKGQLPLPGEDTEASMYDVLMNTMEKKGISQYEISNFAKKGYESKHNLVYWSNEEYYGFGAGAHSYVKEVRRSNHGPLKKYMDPLEKGHLDYLEEHTTTVEERMEEEMFLGLRKVEGISVKRFNEKFNQNPFILYKGPLQELFEKGWVTHDEQYIKLTREGRFLGNEVFQYFLQ